MEAWGAKALWDASPTKALGVGMGDPELAEQVSRLVGMHDVGTTTTSSSRQHGVQTSVRQQRILQGAAADHRRAPGPDPAAALVGGQGAKADRRGRLGTETRIAADAAAGAGAAP